VIAVFSSSGQELEWLGTSGFGHASSTLELGTEVHYFFFFARNWQVLQGVSVSWEVSWVIIGSNWLSQQLKHPLPTAEWHSKRGTICSDLWKHQRSHFQRGSYSPVPCSSAGLGPSPAQLIGNSFFFPHQSECTSRLSEKGSGWGRKQNLDL
jgi:hypothetical protein